MDPLAVFTFIAAPAINQARAMPEAAKQPRFASRRVRALTAFYVSLGAFAVASLTSLVGASLVLAHLDAGDGAPGRRIDIDAPA
jgi:hypothetical protein